jgi:hypothetical protein
MQSHVFGLNVLLNAAYIAQGDKFCSVGHILLIEIPFEKVVFVVYIPVE